ncbi:MAG: AI-2E family transporter [Alphaproteobacteria bacterium]|nr:AI-2E family transporter [Alphaproteobacteria bacterium]MBN2675175.1 AI-2E family transporter [Alphaproteobacteria bacterium]
MNGLILFIGIIFILWLGKAIFIPILVAAFIWYLMNAISTYYRKAMPFKIKDNKDTTFSSRLFDWVSKILSFLTFFGLTYLFVTQIRPMFSELVIALPEIQEKLMLLGDYLSGFFGFSFNSENLPNMSGIITSISSSAAGLITTTGMVLVYIFFMFVEQSTFTKKFSSLFPNKTQSKKMRYILNSIDDNMKKYMFMKTFVSGFTAILSYIWLTHIGLEFAGIWAFIVFIMNYIPTIGAIIACSLPILYSLVTADTMNLPILTAVGLITLQVILGNILEPKLTGKTLNLSTLAILINLVFWGMLWGVAGMFFSVPLLVATFIITAQFDSTRWIAVLLSANGEIPDKND